MKITFCYFFDAVIAYYWFSLSFVLRTVSDKNRRRIWESPEFALGARNIRADIQVREFASSSDGKRAR